MSLPRGFFSSSEAHTTPHPPHLDLGSLPWYMKDVDQLLAEGAVVPDTRPWDLRDENQLGVPSIPEEDKSPQVKRRARPRATPSSSPSLPRKATPTSARALENLAKSRKKPRSVSIPVETKKGLSSVTSVKDRKMLSRQLLAEIDSVDTEAFRLDEEESLQQGVLELVERLLRSKQAEIIIGKKKLFDLFECATGTLQILAASVADVDKRPGLGVGDSKSGVHCISSRSRADRYEQGAAHR